MKLSKRLKQLESMVTTGLYRQIWDCCCDHGLLGTALLSRGAAPSIHFVDKVPQLTQQLGSKLHRFYPDVNSRWTIHCLDAAELPLGRYEGKNLIIIAGVGGDLITGLVTTLHRNYPDVDMDFLLCPVYHQFMLRQQLIELDFNLKNELLIKDNNRFYELLLVSVPASIEPKSECKPRKISPVGELIWQVNSEEQAQITAEYRDRTLNHYERMVRRKNADVQHIIEAYRSVIPGA